VAASGKKPGGRAPAPPLEGPQPKDQINLTDEDSRIMLVAGVGFEQCYRRRRSPRVWHRREVPQVSRQWAIRQRMAASTVAPFDIRDSVVRPISREAAARVITLFEPMPAIVTHTFGLFFGDMLAAVVVYGPESGHNLRPATGNSCCEALPFHRLRATPRLA
jgi:hypothetical protein